MECAVCGFDGVHDAVRHHAFAEAARAKLAEEMKEEVKRLEAINDTGQAQYIRNNYRLLFAADMEA